MALNSIGSGILYNATLVLELKDFDNQTMNLDNASQIKISPVTSNAKVSGIDFARSINGVGSFSSLYFVYKPGAQNVIFQANSKAIDSSLVKSVFGSTISNFSISVNFRYWKPGEYIVSSQECLEWSQGTYSLEWNSTSWSTCMNTAVWNGGTEIELNSGYWRRTLNSTDIIDWPRTDSCYGGYYESQEFPVGWAEGYSEYLWTTWVIANGTKFMRVGDYECNLWPNPIYNAIRVVGLLLLIFLFMIFLIIVNIRKRKESQNSILLRIFTNYLQLLATAMSYNLKFPPALVNAFYPVQKVGTTQESFLSFDWFVENADIKAFTPSTTIFKLFLTPFLPLALILLFAVVFIILYLSSIKWFKDIKRNIIISSICILYLLHPTLTKTSLSLFQCTTVDTNMKRVTIEMTIECYSSTHLFWAIAVGIPMIVVWVLGMPAVMLYILIKNRNKLNDDSVKKYYLIIYQGLRHDIFYWEFINVIRKVILYICNVLLSTYNGFYRASISIVFLVILFRLQVRLKPYKFEQNNMIEMLAINCGMITLFGGILFVEQTDSSILFIQMFALVFILLINIYFILKWAHLFVYSYSTKNYIVEMFRKVLSFVLMVEKKTLLELQDKILTTTTKLNTEIINHKEVKKKNKKVILYIIIWIC